MNDIIYSSHSPSTSQGVRNKVHNGSNGGSSHSARADSKVSKIAKNDSSSLSAEPITHLINKFE